VTQLWERILEAAGDGAMQSWLDSRSEIGAGGLPRSAWPLFAGSVARAAARQGRWTVVLAPGPERLWAQLRPWLAGDPVAFLFAEVTVSVLDRPPAQDEAVVRRLQALGALAERASPDQVGVLVSSRRAAMRPTLSREDLRQGTLELRPGLRADPIRLAAQLVELGFSREALVEAPGQFSLRGGILDVFPGGDRSPVRAEFFGDEIETLRLFDPENQRSVMSVPALTVRPGRELLLGEARGTAAVDRIRSGSALQGLRADVLAEWDDELERLAAGSAFPGIELFSAYLHPELPSLFDHLPDDAVVVDLDPRRQIREVEELEQEIRGLAAAEAGDGELPRGFQAPIVPAERLRAIPGRTAMAVTLGEAEESGVRLGWTAAEPLVARPSALADLVLRPGQTVVLASEQAERLQAWLETAGVRTAPLLVDLDLSLELDQGLYRADLDLPIGSRHEGLGLTLLTDAELFGRVQRAAARPSRRPDGGAESAFSLEFQPGELVVHVDHGLARVAGLRLIDDGDGANREYLELEYAEGDRLFVPVESLDRIQKYIGGSEARPSLHRLGTGDWERARSRARRSVEDVAEDLLKIYAAREARAGFPFAPDTPWQAELEASFQYEETPDQLAAMTEIKADMEADRPMDRLLCGDVGFGKTELAVRAAFKAVMSGRQVALLAPTTVLAQQHLQVFQERLQPYPVTVDMLSRFRSPEEQAETLAGLRSGQVDIVIGTHRLLQSDVKFKSLGLVIVDEEQRFGVMQKERLKRMRTQIDVLSMSATPIPRTLHMAVAGIRDMSVVQTPPEDRQPIKTYVAVDDDEMVREVIQRELERGGQVYYVHNRVRTIDKAAQRVERLLPEARVVVGHGQMEEQQLARVMVEFASGRFDVLVCTTIIESGLDIPNVNTLLVERSDRFGLSQLYQLRGRVGRSGKRAYAYFLYDPKRSLTEAADKRLDVISGLHELGQGFRIALRDLEIRGAGNLLGVEQHGAIAAVGFEMYMQMLQRAVAALRTGKDEAAVGDVLSTPEMNLDLPLDHFIPRSYIRDERLRLGAYRQLAAAEREEEMESVLRSLRDRYGPPPGQLDNLAYSLRVKIRGQRLGLRSVAADGREIVLRVDPDRFLEVDELVSRFSGRVTVAPNRIRFRRQGEGWRADLLALLDAMAELYERARISSHA
jgi:transcription-repair coupling factor (superfamily II helicase)